MAATCSGHPRTWGMSTDSDGWDTFTAQFLIKCDDTEDGPDTARQATGAPQTGDPWIYGNDSRPDVYCLPQKTIEVYRGKKQDPGFWWILERQFSNKAAFIGSRPRISGGFTRFTKEVVRDRFGNPVTSTSFEMFRGPQAEFDNNRPSVKIEYAVSDLDVGFLAALIDRVNISEMWGCPPRCVKLDNAPWEEKYDDNGVRYFTYCLEFSIFIVENLDGDLVSGWDRDLLNEGTKALGQWRYPTATISDAEWDKLGGNVDNPKDYFRYHDKKGNIARVILKHDGTPWNGIDPPLERPPAVHVEYYKEADFVLALGVPDPLFS